MFLRCLLRGDAAKARSRLLGTGADGLRRAELMAQADSSMTCEICEKVRMVGNKRSHSNIKTKKVQSANIQKVRAMVGKEVRRVKVCSRCLRSGKVLKVPARSSAASA